MLLLSGLSVMFRGGPLGVIGGVLFIVRGGLFARIGCELMIVVFKMNEALQEIRRK